jgi:hypothetical protein
MLFSDIYKADNGLEIGAVKRYVNESSLWEIRRRSGLRSE